MRTPKRPTVEACRNRIGVSDIAPAGESSPRNSGTIRSPGFVAEFVVRGRSVEIQFQQEGFPLVTEEIRLKEARPYLGGRRWWLCCTCGRLASRLYVRGGWLRCRACHGLVFTTAQKAHARERAGRRLEKLMNEAGPAGVIGMPDTGLSKAFNTIVLIDKLETLLDPEHVPQFPCNARNQR